VEIGEALDFLLVLNWVHETQLKNVDFELDVATLKTSQNVDAIISFCRLTFGNCRKFSVVDKSMKFFAFLQR
jgi:hypothetical protein